MWPYNDTKKIKVPKAVKEFQKDNGEDELRIVQMKCWKKRIRKQRQKQKPLSGIQSDIACRTTK